MGRLDHTGIHFLGQAIKIETSQKIRYNYVSRVTKVYSIVSILVPRPLSRVIQQR